jgi:hypothetical protein
MARPLEFHDVCSSRLSPRCRATHTHIRGPHTSPSMPLLPQGLRCDVLGFPVTSPRTAPLHIHRPYHIVLSALPLLPPRPLLRCGERSIVSISLFSLGPPSAMHSLPQSVAAMHVVHGCHRKFAQLPPPRPVCRLEPVFVVPSHEP